MSDVIRFLETVYGHGSGWVHLSTTKRQLAAVKCSNVAELAGQIDTKTDVYLSAAVIETDKGSGDSGRTSRRRRSVDPFLLWGYPLRVIADRCREGTNHQGG